uniref:Putative nuclear envelope integral membrane protein 1 n=1 Tax=Anopheles marajoara TaxID=58244 RepID=A0A2M4BPR0_9DIPT
MVSTRSVLCLLVIGLWPSLAVGQETKKNKVNFLQPDRTVRYTPDEWSIYRPGLVVYCHHGQEETPLNAFLTVTLKLDCDHEDFNQYPGNTPTEVEKHWQDDQSLFSFNLFASKKRRLVELDPFNQSCLGIVSSGSYEMTLLLNRFDVWRVGMLLFGTLIFFTAHALSQNSLFYYFGGIVLGVASSALIIVYFFSKLLPYRPLMYGVMLGGWTLGICGLQMLYENMRVIFVVYRHYVFWYMLVVGSITFLICYRMGPPRNPRSKQVIQWALQLMALALMFFSTYQRTLGACIVTVATTGYFLSVPIALGRWLLNKYYRLFPAKRRLLTLEEFEQQGIVETAKALDQLREYCRSPDCKQWKTILKLQEPVRFASFIEGSNHLLDEEISEYEARSSCEDVSISEDELDETNPST